MKKLFYSFAALAAVVACNQNGEMNPPAERQVTIVAQASETKTVLEGGAVKWEANDAVRVRFDKHDANSVFETFTTADGGETATFAGKLANDVSVTGGYNDVAYAVYPASALTESGVSASLDATVEASASFASGKNLSSAVVDLSDLAGTGTASATFKNAFAIIRYTLDPGVQSLVLTADKPLVGTAAMVFDQEGRLVKSDEFTSSSNTLTINPPTGGFVANETYNVLVFPGEFTTLKAEMTDNDNCTFSKENSNLTFEAAKFYTFNFTNPANFDKTYSFTATGRTFADGETVQVVIAETPSADAVLTYADGKFTGKTTHQNVEDNKAGYAVYPASAYNNGAMSYTLPADGTQPTSTEIWAAPFTLKATSVEFESVKAALSQLTFTVPEGVASVNIASSVALVGEANVAYSNGAFALTGYAGTEINVASASDTYTLYVYPAESASLTVTLTDSSNHTVELDAQTLTFTAGAATTLDLSGEIKFDKNGSFTHEGFETGGEAIEF